MKISEKKRERISEQILFFLFSAAPKPLFTINIANEIARDEEFTKKLLIGLRDKGFIVEIKKNPKGVPYIRRSRWKLSNKVYEHYRNS